jgi:hypothetical protein
VVAALTGTILVEPVLFCSPVFFTPDWWSEGTHAWDWVRPETPLVDKPVVELDVSLDVTLGEVIEAACEVWRILPGRGMEKYSATRRDEFFRFGFVDARRDADGGDEQWGYQLPSELQIARETGAIESVPAMEVTYRELLASSSLGVLEDDVTRPYVHPVRPQGDAGLAVEVGRLTVEAIRAAYAYLDQTIGSAPHTIRVVGSELPRTRDVADQVVDEGVRVAFLLGLTKWCWNKLRSRGGHGNS